MQRQTGRVLGLVAVVVAIGLAVTAIPSRNAELREVCSAVACAPGQLTPEMATALSERGISIAAYAVVTLALDIAAALAYLVMAGLLLWRRDADRMALLVGALFVGLALDTFPLPALAGSGPFWKEIAEVNWSLSIGLGVVFFAAMFPSGRVVPRWARWVLAFAVFEELNRILVPNSPFSPESWSEQIQGLELLGWIALMVIWQVYRFRRVSSQIEKQQTKWVLLGFSATLAANLVSILVPILLPAPSTAPALSAAAASTLVDVSLLFTPVAIFIAISRYQLFEINRVVKRTLVYGLLTGLLVTLYAVAASILGIAVSRQRSPLVVAVSTLVVAAAFGPLRVRIQGMVDRRFDRRTYDAAKTLKAFAARTGHETDLEVVVDDLHEVVDGTLGPSFVALWFRHPAAPP